VLLILFYPNLGTLYIPSDRLTMYIGVTTFKNELGMTCMVCGLSSLWSFLDAYNNRRMPHRARHLLAHGALLLTAVGLIVTADAMTSLSCLALAGTVMVIISQRLVASGARTVHAAVGAAIGLAVFALFVDSAGTLVQSLGRNQNLTGRTWIWQAVLSLHTNPFIGTGFQTFWMGTRLQKVWDMTAVGIQEAHNGYLDLYLNLGWIGLLFLGGLMVTGYRDALGAFSRDPHAGSLRLAFFTAALIFSLTEAGFGMMSLIWIAFLLAVTITPNNLQATELQRSAEMPLTPIVLPRPSRLLR
jgi:O-antigen ligase